MTPGSKRVTPFSTPKCYWSRDCLCYCANKRPPWIFPAVLGLFNETNNGNDTNHVVAVELDTVYSYDSKFGDINDNHVGIDINGLRSYESAQQDIILIPAKCLKIGSLTMGLTDSNTRICTSPLKDLGQGTVGDVKASNVLLDGELNGRLGDFGLARLYDHGTDPQTTHIVGTLGYLAPEHARTGKEQQD
ncbi:hypothetical protein GH714_014516 [Hevea brasiliensis]|uniref:non-specific serine/threonine protein kinase n=1 Tax=Hevea brasiliensis TaxID=3981 RepID=A0A6A6LUB1_HEVBR|nr:hypothetical protein GH714_014516 [Hevea brasiliensis]